MGPDQADPPKLNNPWRPRNYLIKNHHHQPQLGGCFNIGLPIYLFLGHRSKMDGNIYSKCNAAQGHPLIPIMIWTGGTSGRGGDLITTGRLHAYSKYL